MLFHIVEKKKRSRPMSPKAQLEQEKRMRREIANSNERRRMQCINAGFQGLRALMPQLSGEKLSKAAILQHTKEYIAKKEQELKQAKSQNEQLKRMLLDVNRDRDLADRQSDTPPPKRKKRDTECSDEGIGLCDVASEVGVTGVTSSLGVKDVGGVSAAAAEDLQRELTELRQQLERERMMRVMMEDRARTLEAQLVHSSSSQPPPPPPHHQHLSLSRISPSPLSLSSSSPQHHFAAAAGGDLASSPINLKVESPRQSCHSNSSPVQEISAHEEQRPATVPPPPQPAAPTPTSTRLHHHYDHHPNNIHSSHANPHPHPHPHKPNSNLQNLVEAIRQIEGDRVLGDEETRYVSPSPPPPSSHHHLSTESMHTSSSSSSLPLSLPRPPSSSHHASSTLHCSEESEKESSISDPDESKSEGSGSGRDSPSPLGLCARSLALCVSGSAPQAAHHHHHNNHHHHHHHHHQQSAGGILSEKYPIASHLLHRPPYFSRPGVIVHKS